MIVLYCLTYIAAFTGICYGNLKGDRGLPGLRGVGGEDGQTGPQGPNGYGGRPGLDGEKGRRGPNGEPGARGIPGVPGEIGLRGDYGLGGRKGLKGKPGLSGLPGMKGQKGDMGYDGIPGRPGLPGTPGQPGEGLQCDSGRQEPVAFSAHSADVSEPTKEPRPLRFDTVHVDTNNFFDAENSRFVAPSDGQYFFSVVAIADGSTSIPIVLHHRSKEVLCTSGQRDATDIIYPVGANRITLSLSRGETVEIRVKAQEDAIWKWLSNAIYSQTDVTLSAYKILNYNIEI